MKNKHREKFLVNGLCGSCGKLPPVTNRKHCQPCATREKDNKKHKHAENRKCILDFMGGACACCGEAEPKFLSVDHVNNDGNVQRRVTGDGGRDLYRQLVAAIQAGTFPTDLQLLCRNCNWGKHVNNGVCPHITRYL